MNYVESFNLLGIEAKQIPCIKGEGAPTTSTEGAVGCFYMDTLTGDIYKYVNAEAGSNPWVLLKESDPEQLQDIEDALVNKIDVEEQSFTDEQKARARENIGAWGDEKLVQTTGDSETAVMSQKAVTDYVSEYIEKSPSRNLLNVTWENAKLFNGVFTSSTSTKQAAFADFIPVVGGENYTLSWVTSEQSCYVYLHKYKDKNERTENYIGCDKQNYVTTNKASEFVYSLEEECKYIRIFLENNGTAAPETWEENIPENFQFELGTEATTYIEPLTIDAKIIDDIALGEKMSTNGVIPKADNYLDRLPLTETLTADVWERGSINATNGSETNTAYFRTKDYIQLRKGDEIKKASSGNYIAVFEYDLITKEYILSAYTSGFKNSYIVQNNCFVRIIHWADANSSAPSNVVITRNTRERLSLGAMPLPDIENVAAKVADEKVAKVTDGYISIPKYAGSLNPFFKQIAHRGYRGTGAPQCTAPAYIEAKKFGYIAGENDLQITTDGIFVMAHNVTLPSDSSIIVNQSTYQTLINGNMGTFKGKEVDLMTFEEWLILMKKIGLEPYVDLKATLTVEQAAEAMAVVRKHGLLDKVTWSGGKTSAVNLRAAYANARIALLYSDELPNFDSLEDLIIDGHPELTVLYMKSTSVDEAFMTEAINKGFSVECWHCDYSANGFTTEEAILREVERVLELGVTGICLDTYLPCEYFINKFNSEWGLD